MILFSKQKAQDYYDRLIALSDIAFKRSQELESSPFSYGWELKAEAYHYAAELFMNMCALQGFSVEFKQTKWYEYFDKLRREGVESDMDESFYYEEIDYEEID